MTWGTDRLAQLKAGTAELPPVVTTLRLGTLDDWGPGWVRKYWHCSPELLQSDGTMFGGYLAALADQALALAAMSVAAPDRAFRTTHLAIQFFKLTKASNILIEANVIAQSRQVISVDASFHDDTQNLIAKASAQQVTTPFP